MITYLAVRLITWLYGYNWPLQGNARNAAAGVSIVETTLEIVFIVCFCCIELPGIIARRRINRNAKKENHQ